MESITVDRSRAVSAFSCSIAVAAKSIAYGTMSGSYHKNQRPTTDDTPVRRANETVEKPGGTWQTPPGKIAAGPAHERVELGVEGP